MIARKRPAPPPAGGASTSAAVPRLDPEALRVEIYNALVHCIVSNAALWATVDVAEVKAVMADAIAAVPDAPLSLEPLWRYMRQKGTPADAGRQSIFLFHSRAPRFRVTVVLPAELARVADADRAHEVEALRARGGTTGTFVGRAPAPPPPASPPTTTAATTAGKSKGRAPRAAARSVSSSALRVVVAVAALTFVVEQALHPDETAKAQASLGALCQSLYVRGHAAVCTASARALDDRSAARNRAEVTGAALGLEVVFVDDAGEVLDFAE